jgi:hypothetical protein
MKIGKLPETITKHIAQQIRSTTHLPLMIVGPPGIGKTDITKSAAKAISKMMGDITVDTIIMHPVVKTDVDFGGHPAIVDGEATHLAYSDLKTLCNAKDVTIVLLDDVGQSKPSVQAALMQIVRERSVNGMHISKKVHFILATNRREDRAGVTGILSTLSNRAVSVNVEVDPDAFANWLRENCPDQPVLEAFIRHRPDHLIGEHLDDDQKAAKIGVGIPTPRSITMICDHLRAGHSLDVLEALLYGTVGKPFAAEFIGFQSVYHNVVRYEDVVADPHKVKLPNKADGRYAQCTMLCQKVKKKDLEAIAVYVYRIGKEFTAYFWSLVEKSRKELVETKTYIDWRKDQKY